jgi:hypothetical protein
MVLYRKFADGTSRIDTGRNWEVDDLVRDRTRVVYAAELEVVEGVPTAAPLFGDDKANYRGAVEAAQEFFN